MPQTCRNKVWSYEQFTMPHNITMMCGLINDLLCHKHVAIKSDLINDLLCHKHVAIKSDLITDLLCHIHVTIKSRNKVWSYKLFIIAQTCHKSGASCWSFLHSSTIHTVVFRITYVSYFNNQYGSSEFRQNYVPLWVFFRK